MMSYKNNWSLVILTDNACLFLGNVKTVISETFSFHSEMLFLSCWLTVSSMFISYLLAIPDIPVKSVGQILCPHYNPSVV